MFKRVQKRQRRKEKEEELGLDEDMKEVLGLQDTDSDESDSDSSEGSSDSEDDSAAEAELDGDNDDGDAEASDDEQEDDGQSTESESDEDELPPMSVTEAVRDPVYLVKLDPEVKACIVCPGKLLKNSTMSDVHKTSKAHNRRFTRFVELVGKTGPEGDVRNIIRMMGKEGQSAPTPARPKADGELSKRAQKRKEKLAAIQSRRTMHKEKVAAAIKRKALEKEKKLKDAANPSTAAGAKRSDTVPAELPKSSKQPRPIKKQPLKKKRKMSSTEDI